MTVARILATKGRGVIGVQPHRTLLEVTEILMKNKIGAVVVTDAHGHLLGIISERDIVMALGQRGPIALEDAVSTHMTSHVVTVSEDETVHETVSKMNRGRFRHLPVLLNGRLCGLVSIGDVVKYRLEEMEKEKNAILEYIAMA
ncbi:CBS domain-containing protein [Beijerinckia indica]|uniref:Putative signal-transduction protein with CBS domains n=1 Tax=Beijerinckia indica subsp. indica (strain ATCC 9039 / DSM 1715 / NCIMB 8712) TaxID=395963 RepID=B2IBC8_BEII9|nr:CBS domain-containing protein [Beijerinckia indica]ACB95212.1 putative signal-transduction protein with CBS domains [Beijerinckia indica subsp. indica ATCC 9039]